MCRNFYKKINSNRQYFWGISEKVVRSLSQPISIVFVTFFLDLKSQGFLYTFISLISIKFLLELGLTQIIITFIAYEKNNFKWNSGFLKGKFTNYLRFKKIANYSFKWFMYSSFIYLILISCVGFLLFNDSTENIFFWLYPFLILSILSSLEIAFIPIYAIKEGLGELVDVYRYRFYKASFFIISFVSLIVMEFGIWSFSISLLSNVLIDIFFIAQNRKIFIIFLRKTKKELNPLNIIKEILPLQIKTGIGAISGFATFFLITPYTFSLLGAETAGKVGLTLALVTGISGLSIVPTIVSIQRMAYLVSTNEILKIKLLIFKLLIFMFLTHILAAIFLLLCYNFFIDLYPQITNKFLTPDLFVMYFIASMLSVGTMPLTIYMRAHKKEPIMLLSIITGLLISIGSYYGIIHYAELGAAVVYLGAISITIPFYLKIFNDFNQKITYKK